MKEEIRENAKRYFEEELSGEPLHQDSVVDWLTEFAEQQVKLFATHDIIERVVAHQNNSQFHPLTCGNNINHTPLVPIQQGNSVILICVDCDYKQDYIPI